MEDLSESTNISSNSSSSSCRPPFGWWPYVVAYTGVFFSGIALIGAVWLLQAISPTTRNFVITIKNKLIFLLDQDTVIGKAHFILTTLANCIYMSLMMYRSSSSSDLYSNCNTMSTAWTHVLELIVCMYLILNCILETFIMQWFSILNIVDILTLVHPFVSFSCGYDWLGLRSLRFMWLGPTLGGILKMIPWGNMEDVMEMSSVSCRFISLWLAGSGLIQVLENGGDFWDERDTPLAEEVNDTMTFWSSAYLAMITLSTVGYGDITVHSIIGRIFMIAFILIGLIVYAASLPVFIEFLLDYHKRSKYRKAYSKDHPLEHLLIVMGHVTQDSASCLLKELFHPDKKDRKTFVIFLHVSSPSPGLCALVKSYDSRVRYYQGSPLSVTDLTSCGICHAKSVLVLTNRQMSDPFAEDHSNLLIVATVKKARPCVQIILQLLNFHSKVFLSSLSGWNYDTDAVLCLNEWKMRTLAQTCITPGFCTLFSNLLFANGSRQLKWAGSSPWRRLYVGGACAEVYSTCFSPSFIGMTISETASVCYKVLGLTLLGVSRGHTVIHHNTLGYFITNEMGDLKPVRVYCSKCHRSDGRAKRIKPCSCTIGRRKYYEESITPRSPLVMSAVASLSPPPSPPLTQDNGFSNGISDETTDGISTRISHGISTDISHGISNGISHGISDKISPLRLTPPLFTHSPLSSPPVTLNDHIVLCIFANPESTTIGLSSFLTPLQSLNHDIVIVTESEYFMRELTLLESTHSIYFIPGLPLISTSLKGARIDTCKACIILSAPKNDTSQVYGIEDREVILCALKLHHQLGDRVKIISDLGVETHIHLLDNTSDTQWDQPANLTNPFALGQVFLTSVFNSLTTVVFHNPGIHHLLDSLMLKGETNSAITVITISTTSYIGQPYGVLYDDMARNNNVLCIGIHRQVELGSQKRFIITAPPSHLVLLSEDNVLCLSL